MLSLSQAKWFFLGGTAVTFLIFFGLTAHTFTRIPELTNQDRLTEQVAHGKHLWAATSSLPGWTVRRR